MRDRYGFELANVHEKQYILGLTQSQASLLRKKFRGRPLQTEQYIDYYPDTEQYPEQNSENDNSHSQIPVLDDVLEESRGTSADGTQVNGEPLVQNPLRVRKKALQKH
jgi:hypothetical protein